MAVQGDVLEEARARMLELQPGGFEEVDGALVAYTDADGERSIREAFDDVRSEPVEPGWEERWREFHRPLWIGPLWIGPTWEKPPADAIAVVIDPGQAFGTGSHPTTRLCLGFLVDLEPGGLLDIGCGSGVLSVAAAKLGFTPIVALDREAAAVEATRRNAAVNGVAVDARRADALAVDLPTVDLTVANIDLASVEALGDRVNSRLLVTAGYFHSRDPRPVGFAHRERRIDGGWAADLFERQ